MRRVSWNLPIATQQCRNYCTTSPEQIEVMKLKRYSKAMCNKRALNHDAIESLSLSCRCHKQTDNGRFVDIHTYIYIFYFSNPEHTHKISTYKNNKTGIPSKLKTTDKPVCLGSLLKLSPLHLSLRSVSSSSSLTITGLLLEHRLRLRPNTSLLSTACNSCNTNKKPWQSVAAPNQAAKSGRSLQVQGRSVWSVYVVDDHNRYPNTHTHTHTFNGPFVRDYPGEPVPER